MNSVLRGDIGPKESHCNLSRWTGGTMDGQVGTTGQVPQAKKLETDSESDDERPLMQRKQEIQAKQQNGMYKFCL